jgi:hypothetical protein
MKRGISISFFIIWLVLCASAQVSRQQLYGVWGVAAMGKAGEDTVVRLTSDTAIADAFGKKIFVHVSDRIYATNNPDEKRAYDVLGWFSNMFFQFDSTDRYGEGLKPDASGMPLNMKRGTYILDGTSLVTKTTTTEYSSLEIVRGYLVVKTDTGSVMYLEKLSDKLY